MTATATRESDFVPMLSDLEVSIVMPCLNEAETIVGCIVAAREGLDQAQVVGEVIVADNGSDDGSPELAIGAGARVVATRNKGYGRALLAGIAAANGRYILMGDADGSYDFRTLPAFLTALRSGHDFVIGNRFRGGINRGAMPWLHKWIGNPVLSRIGSLFYGVAIGDFHCGLRAFSKSAFDRLALRSPGMEFASEMVVKAALYGLTITEVPTTLAKDGRSRPPHLRTWRDGWRHLRLLLLLSPRWLFLIPGAAFMAFGASINAWLLPEPRRIGPLGLDIHTMLVAAGVGLVGYQLVWFAACTKIFAVREGFHPLDTGLNRLLRHVRLETGLAIGSLLVITAVALISAAFANWEFVRFSALDPRYTMRLIIPATTLLVLGMQTIFSSFFLSILGMPGHGTGTTLSEGLDEAR